MGEGSSIDFEEPVVITIQCDSDGWVMQVDKLLYITLNFEDLLITKLMCTNEDLIFVIFSPQMYFWAQFFST